METALDRVLLLHGIARTSASLAKLARGLNAAGFATLNLKPVLKGVVGEV